MIPIILHVVTNTNANFGYAGLGVQGCDSLRDPLRVVVIIAVGLLTQGLSDRLGQHTVLQETSNGICPKVVGGSGSDDSYSRKALGEIMEGRRKAFADACVPNGPQ